MSKVQDESPPKGGRSKTGTSMYIDPAVIAAVDQYADESDRNRSQALNYLLRSHPDMTRYLPEHLRVAAKQAA